MAVKTPKFGMHFVDYHATKGKYCCSNFSVFFPSKTTLNNLRLAMNNVRNFLYLNRVFPYGQNCVILLKSCYQLKR